MPVPAGGTAANGTASVTTATPRAPAAPAPSAATATAAAPAATTTTANPTAPVATAAPRAPAPANPVAPAPIAPAAAPAPATPSAAGPVRATTVPATTISGPVPGSAAAAAVAVDDPQFPHLPILRTKVGFWTSVFSNWSENQSVIHAIDDLGKVYAVLDFRADAAVLSPGALAAQRSREEKAAFARLDATLNQLQAMQDRDGHIDADALDAEQRKVYDLFANSRDPKRFRDAIGGFRIQRGLKERTQLALETSGRYLPEMERIFSSHGLPPKLTRLPLVESSFNVEAYSKAAAAGLWQFIPSSARIYMRLDELVDDRRDPWTSTDAAARHLKDDYEVLGNWPLALTAYNYGRGGLARALTEVGGTTLTDVLERYQGKRFGFASSNFYAEFLAASDVERDYRTHFGNLTREPPLAFETVTTRHYVRYDTLRKLAGSDEDEFRRLNPAYRPEVVEGRLYVPPGNTIRVPAGAAQRFELAYATLTPEQRFDRQRQLYSSHRVARGETVGQLAQRYGVSTQALLALNGLANAKRVRVGQTLKIPLQDGGMTSVAAAGPTESHVVKVKAEKLAAARAERVRTHRVKSGQTLGAIAKRYQTSIRSLRELNGLGENDLLRVGSTIKIPGG